MKPDGPTPDKPSACTRETYTHIQTRVHKLSHGRGARTRVGPSGAPIGAGFARRDTRRVTRRDVGTRARLLSLTHTHKKTGMEKEKKPLRLAMPFTTRIIDDFRTHWPEAGIVQSVRAGMDGQPTFHAREAGHEVGTPIPYDQAKAVSVATMIEAGTFTPSKPAQATTKGRRHG